MQTGEDRGTFFQLKSQCTIITLAIVLSQDSYIHPFWQIAKFQVKISENSHDTCM